MLSLLLSISQVSGRLCQGFGCDPTGLISLDSYCVYQEGGYFNLALCNDEFYNYCSPELNDTYCSLPQTSSDIGVSYPGEPCTFDRNCLTSICMNGFCQGGSVNAPCSVSTQCNPGLFCNSSSSQCESLITNNISICESDYDCGYFMGCWNYTCIQYFSLDIQIEVDTCSELNTNYLCKYGTCQNDDGSGTTVCASANPSPSALPISCSNDGDCMIVDEGFNYTTQCFCGFNSGSNSFCGLAPGDQLFKNYMGMIRTWLSSNNVTNCHSERRDSFECISTYASNEFLVNITYYQAAVQYFPQIQQNDECIKAIYTADYWNAYDAFVAQQNNKMKKSGAVFVGLGGILALILAS